MEGSPSICVAASSTDNLTGIVPRNAAACRGLDGYRSKTIVKSECRLSPDRTALRACRKMRRILRADRRTVASVQRLFCNEGCTNALRAVDGHIPLAHTMWSQVIRKGDIIIDATCGRGNDSLFLSKIALSETTGLLYCLDIQAGAINETKERLTSFHGPELVSQRTRFILGSHEIFPSEINPESVSAIVYNLGYFPGSHKEGEERLTTKTESTIKSFENALPLLKIGGVLTATAYRGHKEGIIETDACQNYFSNLNQTKWRVFSHTPINTVKGAILFTVCRR